MTRLHLVIAGALLVSAAACTAAIGDDPSPTELSTPSERPTPTGQPGATAPPDSPSSATKACEETFSPVRCANMVDYAAAQLQTSRDEIVTIELLPPPTPELVDGVSVINLGGATVDTVVRLRDGSVHEVSMGCGGIPPLHCRDDPRLEAASPTLAGYWGCALLRRSA